MPLTSDAKKYNAPRHFGDDMLALDESDELDRPEILPLNKPILRRAKEAEVLRRIRQAKQSCQEESPSTRAALSGAFRIKQYP